MKPLIPLFAFVFLLTSCMSYTGYYSVGLQEVESSQNNNQSKGDSKIVNLEDNGVTKYSYEDSLISITWLPLSTQLSFSLNNKTDHSIKIIWDEAVFVDIDGSSGRVIHSGVRYIDRNSSQPATIVVKNGKIDDMVVPTDNIYYISGQYGGWRTKPLFPNSATSEEELKSLTQKYIGQTVKVLLPIEIQGTVNEYIFSFKVDDFIQKK